MLDRNHDDLLGTQSEGQQIRYKGDRERHRTFSWWQEYTKTQQEAKRLSHNAQLSQSWAEEMSSSCLPKTQKLWDKSLKCTLWLSCTWISFKLNINDWVYCGKKETVEKLYKGWCFTLYIWLIIKHKDYINDEDKPCSVNLLLIYRRFTFWSQIVTPKRFFSRWMPIWSCFNSTIRLRVFSISVGFFFFCKAEFLQLFHLSHRYIKG